MPDETDSGTAPPVEAITADRRRPVARYVEFTDADAQSRFVTAAERHYRALSGSDTWQSDTHVELPTAPPPARRSLFRPRQQQATLRQVPSTPALARVHQITVDTPRELAGSAGSCAAFQELALILTSVTADLVRDLLALTPDKQAAHSAYRQTLRLASELEALRDVAPTQACTGTAVCVRVRAPDHLDRRVEDAEVAEVRAVLVQLAHAALTRP